MPHTRRREGVCGEKDCGRGIGAKGACLFHLGRLYSAAGEEEEEPFAVVLLWTGMESPAMERDALFYTAGCTNDEPKRLKVLEELMTTEQHYLKDLSVLIRGYIMPLRSSQILTENDVDQLCFNIEAIEALHIDIFLTLSQLIEQHKTDPKKSLSYCIAEYFFSISEKLKMYSTYSR